MADELEGQNLVDFVHPDDIPSLAQHLKTLKESPDIAVTLEVRIRRKDGSYSTMESRIRWVESFDGRPVIFANARDISARREMDMMRQTLLRADKLAAIGQLAAGVAHEINNPAAYIATNLFVLKQYVQDFVHINKDLRAFAMRLDPDDREFYLNYLQQNQIEYLLDDMQSMIDTNLQGMDRIKQIISELRGYSRDEGQDLEVFNPNGVVETVSAIARSHIGASGRLVVDLGDVPDVLAHRGKLTQVLINLLVNAAQAIEGIPGEQFVKVTTYLDNEHVCVDVSDTGPGIPDTLQARIFDPFFTTKSSEDGTGLGLWLCREIMTQLKGEILVRSSSQGTVFTLRLARMRTADTAEALGVTFGRLLIVDNPMARWIPVCSELERQRECVRVTDVSSALKVLENDQAFDLVVCPLPMLEQDGRSLWLELRQSWPGLTKRLLVLVPPDSRTLSPIGVKVSPLPASAKEFRGLLSTLELT
jgi:signal transduction histidine kinase